MTLNEIRAKAKKMELEGVDFLDAKGRIGARGGAVKEVRLTFVDGEATRISVPDFRKLADVEFRLRPARDDA